MDGGNDGDDGDGGDDGRVLLELREALRVRVGDDGAVRVGGAEVVGADVRGGGAVVEWLGALGGGLRVSEPPGSGRTRK